jgi:hypothetical protein
VSKYARPELERRLLLAEVPPGRPAWEALIADRYINGTRVRLRRIDRTDGSTTAPAFKLTQKLPAPVDGPGVITTMYLSVAEYDAFAALPAAVLTKTRLGMPPFGIDVFAGELTGLVTAEVEFETSPEYDAFRVPDFAIAEVTGDIRLTGGRLATTSATQLRETLLDYGVHLS